MSNNNTAAISVVVPMHNCADYIEETLHSLTQQTFHDFEVVCVDDGSTDNTFSLVQAFCETDSRFTCIQQENGGAGSARNAGMDKATGTYIIFLDADDEYSPTMFEELYKAATKHQADVAICMFTWQDALLGTVTYNRGLYGMLAKEGGAFAPEDIPDLFTCTAPTPINKFYRLAFLKEAGLRYGTGKIAEDLAFNFLALSLAKRIVGVPKSLATVRTGIDNNSITSGRSKHASVALDVLRAWYAKLVEHGKADLHKDSLLKRCGNAITYETNFAYNEAYLDEVVHMLFHEEPWMQIPYAQKLRYLKLDSAAEQAQLDRLEQELAGQQSAQAQDDAQPQGSQDKDNPKVQNAQAQAQDEKPTRALQQQILSARNRLAAMRYLEQACAPHKPEVSIIVPVYNSAEFIPGLVHSITQQTFENYEVLFVDDGSTDTSASLLQEACADDSRLFLLSTNHAGAGAARNAGLDATSGTYVMFFDADDICDPSFVQKMYETALRHAADEVFCLYEETDNRNGSCKHELGFNRSVFPHDTCVRLQADPRLYYWVSWRVTNVLFRKELIDAYDLRFSTTKVANDTFFTYAYASVAQSAVGIHEELLSVRRYINGESLTSSRWAHTEDILTALAELYEWLKKQGLFDAYKQAYMNLFISSIHYQSGFPYNETYVYELAKTLSTHELWKDIDSETFYEEYWKQYDSKRIEAQLKECAHEASDDILVQALSNRLLVVQAVERVAYEQFGRVLNPHSMVAQLQKNSAQNKLLQSQSTAMESRLKKSKQAQAKIKQSRSWRVGRAVTWTPRKVKTLAKRMARRSRGHVQAGPQLKKVRGGTQQINVSVIIPFHNTGNYIARLLESLQQQTMQELEFIFIDDASTDASANVVKRYANNDPRIRMVVNKTSIGSGLSRNRGIQMAQGDYLSFVDADDWICPNFYEDLYTQAQKDSSDITKGRVVFVDEKGNDVTSDYFQNKNQVIQKKLEEGVPLFRLFNTSHFAALYAKRLFNNPDVKYSSTIRGEDGLFLLNACLEAKSFSFHKDACYYYLQRPDSIVHTSRLECLLSSIQSLKERTEVLQRRGLDENAYAYLSNYAQYCLGCYQEYLDAGKAASGDTAAYLAAFEDAISGVADTQKLLKGVPRYSELRSLLG